MSTQPLVDAVWYETQSRRALERLLLRLTQRYRRQTSAAHWRAFTRRLDTHFPCLFTLLHRVYGQQYDFFYYLEELLNIAALWTVPTLGLLISSFRPGEDAISTGWWTVLQDQAQARLTLDNYRLVLSNGKDPALAGIAKEDEQNVKMKSWS